MPCPYCGAALADGARLCTSCGKLIAPRQPGPPPGSPAPPISPPVLPGQPPPIEPRPTYQPGSSYGSDPYGPFFDPAALPPETADAWRQHRFQATFSVTVLILVHLLSFGMASPFLLGRKYALLPKVRPDDFSTAKAVGFLFIPFFGLYWVFVLCRRLVDRLTLQARLWNVPGQPSKGMAMALAVVWALGAIPYVNLLFFVPLHLVLWPIYLVQIQRFCNRLALEAAPPDVRPSMLALERATRLRWLGWIVVVPCALMLVSSIVVAVVAPPGPVVEMIVGIIFVLALTGCGVALLFLGERGAGPLGDQLERRAPSVLAAYLRIDKNAAWSVVWIATPLAVLFVGVGLSTLAGFSPTTSREEGWPSVALGAALGAGAAYAVWRALRLKQEIARLLSLQPLSLGPESSGW